jgi:hypothetical protein
VVRRSIAAETEAGRLRRKENVTPRRRCRVLGANAVFDSDTAQSFTGAVGIGIPGVSRNASKMSA